MLSNSFRRLLAAKFRISYAQLGEDVVLAHLLKRVPHSYVDLGANHPAYGNNTFYSYLRGGRGICVDANADFIPLYKKWRPGDTFFCSAVSNERRSTLSFAKQGSPVNWHVVSSPAKDHANVEEVPNMHINDILSRVKSETIDVLSVDVESSTPDVIEAIDYQTFRIAIICVEINESEDSKNRAVRHLEQQGFRMVALNPVNALFANPKLCDASPPTFRHGSSMCA
ncbi:MAG: FkbM family methyltransferase [Chthoniobacterales bacterium]